MNPKLKNLKGLLSISCAQSIKLAVVLLLVCLNFNLKAQTEEDLKKQAEQLFEDEDYTKAYKPYSQLVSNYPKVPLYNYRLGVCMLFSEPDKKKCFSYLNKAYNNRQDLPKDVSFFLGKAYHINYLFDEAIRFYNEFKKEAPFSMQKKLQVDREIQACGNGKRLLSTITDLEIISKKQLNESDYFRSYDLSSSGGKLLVKTDVFKTSTDKKKKDKSIMFVTKDGDRIYLSSYGDNALNGRDIYYRDRLPNGEFGKLTPVEGINTEFDEDYPFVHPNGKIIYFASKGHNSMGGYDIFKSTFNDATQSWSTPKNLEFPINSPDDDYLFVTDTSEKFAYFSTGRYSPPGKIDVLKIKTERKPIDLIVMKGTVAKENAKQSVKSKITIKNITTGLLVGTFEAEDNGNFAMQLPNGAKLLYTVETPNLRTQSQGVNLPLARVGRPFKQTITYVDQVLKIVNDFEEPPSDESYLQYLKLIEEKSKLNPNEGQNNLSPTVVSNDADSLLANNTNNPDAIKTTNPTVNTNKNNTTAKNNSNVKTVDNKAQTEGINNKALIDIAKQDADESEKETIQLNQDAKDAIELGTAKKIEAETKLKNADNALANAEAITDEAKKSEETQKAIDQKKEAENDLAVANKILDYSKTLEKDAATKANEASLNKQYAAELEKISTAKNNTPEAKQKLDDLQKQIAAVSEQKIESESVYSDLKNEIAEKEKELAEANEKTNSARNEDAEIKNEVTKTETELSTTKKKKAKAEINTKLNDLKNEQQKTGNSLAQNEEQEKKITEELNVLKNELSLADKIKNENIAKVENTTNITNPPVNNPNKNEAQQLEEKYASKVNITDPNNKNNIIDVNKQLGAYNKDIDALLTRDKASLAKIKKPEERKVLNSEIKNLETIKKQNQQSIANNTSLINELNKQIASGTNTVNNNQSLKEIQTDNPNKALDQLKEIKNALTQADNAVFNYNNYSNTNVQNMKVQADGQINDAYALQNKLKETIIKSEENIKNASVSLTKNSNNPEALLNQSDELIAKANGLRNEAANKQGEEKNKLIQEAVNLEKQAEIKQIEASEASASITADKYNVNKENVQSLISNSKADENTLNQAKSLMDEAETAIKQANAIREEANAMNNNSAKIGNLGNAEEKELIALNKQNEALEFLKKANPDVALKPYKDLKTVNITNETVLKEEIAKVNGEVKQLISAKTIAYKTLSEANDEEIKDLNTNLQSNTTVNSTPALKSQLAVIDKKLKEINDLKTKLDQPTNDTEKLVDLSNLVKKQNEALIAFNKLNSDAEAKTLATNAKANENKTEENNTKTNAGENKTENTNKVVANNNATENKTESKENATAPKNNISSEQANTSFTVDLSYENHKDTSLNQINNFFSVNNFELRNEQANTLKNKSLESLKILENENKQLNEDIAKSNSESSDANSAGNVTNEEIKTKINSLSDASDNLNQEASNVRNEANTKTGEEKESLLNQAKEIDEKAFTKKVEAAQLRQQYNDANYNANSNSINDMLATLNSTNPDLANTLKQKADEIITKKKQAQNLREEANALSNNSARIGAIGNAEEEEADVLQKQNELITELKSTVTDYVVKEPTYSNLDSKKEIPGELKQKQNEINSKQASELTNLTNAFSLEYETNKKLIPKNLNSEQSKIKNNVLNLNAESKNLLIKSTKTDNLNEKIKLLSLASKTGHTAAAQLNVLINKLPTTNLASIDNKVANTINENTNANSKTNELKNNTVASNKNNASNKTTNKNNADNKNTNKNNTENKNITKTKEKEKTNAADTKTTSVATNKTNNIIPKNNSEENTAGTKVIARIEGLEVLNKNAYSEAKPIPIDAKMPDGLIFRVQIGAFKTKIANNSFRGLTPVNGETTPNGYTRYTAGNFNKLENASAVKSDLNKNGYPDAFVVVFFNGKRITLAEALAILEKEGKTLNANPPLTAGISDNVNPNNTTAKANNETAVVVVKELEKTKNLIYTVQIGVYSRQISKARLSNLSPIYSEQLPNGLFRYTAGIYNNVSRLLVDKKRVIDLGIKDAFISAYIDGKRLPYNDAKAKKDEDSTILFEAENPIVFPENTAPPANSNINNTGVITPTFAPYTNSVKDKPVATPENGIKETEEGVTFKVQIGAYSRPVPEDVAQRFNSIKTWPVENKLINGLYIYNIGVFSEAKFAKQLKEEVVALGITDAFITVYKDGKKLFGTEASEYLNK